MNGQTEVTAKRKYITKKVVMSEIGNRIRENREEMKLSQEKFAEILGISTESLSLYENAKSTPKLECIVNMAYIFNVTIEYLLLGTIEENQDEEDPEDRRYCSQYMGLSKKEKRKMQIIMREFCSIEDEE